MRGVPANATLIKDDLGTILWKVYESNIVQRLVYSSRCQGHVERSPRNVILFFSCGWCGRGRRRRGSSVASDINAFQGRWAGLGPTRSTRVTPWTEDWEREANASATTSPNQWCISRRFARRSSGSWTCWATSTILGRGRYHETSRPP